MINDIQAENVYIQAEEKKFEIVAGTLIKYLGFEINIDIPETVHIIGDSALEDMKLIETVKLPDSLNEIGNRAFYGCSSLKQIEMPNAVKKIGSEAFARCSNLKKFIYIKR